MSKKASSLRTVALVGHGDAGKTTFVEHALHRTGVLQRPGTIADRTTVSDHDPLAKDAGHSLDVTCMHLQHGGATIHLLDCPGYPDFLGVATAALAACDTALFFVSAVSGLGVNTRRLWDAAGRLGKARVVVVAKMDADHANPERVLDEIKSAFGDRCRPFNLPVGSGAKFLNVVPCFEAEGAAPWTTLCGDAKEVRDQFFEAVIEADDALLERYLAGEKITHREAAGALTAALVQGTVVPVLFLSSVKGIGLMELLDFLAEDAPSSAAPPGVRATYAGAKESPVSSEGPFLASVFKIASDQHVGKIAYLRVWRGSMPSDGVVWSSATDSLVKLAQAHPSRVQGKELKDTKDVSAGEVVAVSKVDELTLWTTLADPSARAVVAAPTFPTPMTHYAVLSRVVGDEQKVATALHRLLDEDPTLRADRSMETHELIVSGLSTLHLDTVMRRLAQRYKVDLDHRLPRVPLKETVLGPGDGHWRHRKQTGGRGQFAEVFMRVYPNERGAGFRFVDATVGGSIPHNFIPAVEKGVHEQMLRGVIAGYPVVDVVAECYDGKSHAVDSSEAAFKIAGARAFREAFDHAVHALLEPIMEVEIEVPSRAMGDVTGDLSTRRGRISAMLTRDDRQVLRASVPQSEIQSYAADLRSITSGEGSFTVAFSHLDVVPASVARRHIEAFAKHRAHDED